MAGRGQALRGHPRRQSPQPRRELQELRPLKVSLSRERSAAPAHFQLRKRDPADVEERALRPVKIGEAVLGAAIILAAFHPKAAAAQQSFLAAAFHPKAAVQVKV